MNSMMWKTTFREIKSSLGRYLAILAIVALGVGFFAGLKVTRAAMVKTTQAYLTEKQFYDYRVVTTLGLDQEDVELLAAQEGVRAAEGSYTFDILCTDGGSGEMVLRAHSLMERINGVELKAGRMPEAANECVVDNNLFGNSQLGTKIVISSTNDKADKANFAYEEYTVVGLVQSSFYIQFERGNTSLGNGRISGFFYLLPEGFSSDYYTEAFVKFDRDFDLYSEEYDAFLEEKEAHWERLTDTLAAGRYDKVQTLFQEKLADARRKLEDGREEGERELADAADELADAWQEIEDGEAELTHARVELEKGRQELLDSERKLSDGEETLAREERRIEDGETELAEKETLWEEQNAAVREALEELNANQAELDAQRSPLEIQWNMMDTAMSQLISSSQSLDQQDRLLDLQEVQLNRQGDLLANEGTMNEAEKERQLARKQELEAWEASLKEQYGEVPDVYASLIASAKAEVDRYLTATLPEAEKKRESDLAALEESRKKIAEDREKVAESRKEVNRQYLELLDGRSQLQEGLETMDDYQAQIDEGRARLEDAQRQLEEAWAQIEDARRQISDGKVQIGQSKADLAEGRNQLKDGWREWEEGQQEVLDGEASLQEGRQEYQDGLAEYQDARQKYLQEIADAEEEIADAEEQLADMEEADGYLLGRNTNVGYVCFESDSGIVDGIANIFPVFFFAVAALVCITTMNRMVEEQRTQIGVLKALGYSGGRIMGKYLFYSGSAAVIGCVTGFFVGTWLFPRVIWTAYGIMYKVASLQYVFNWKLALISLIVSCACSLGTTWLSCRYELAEVAAELMRPKSPKAGKRVLLEHIPLIWSRLKFLYKVSYRNIFRYKKRFFMMVIGIGGCTALLLTGFGIKDSITDLANDQFERVLLYDIGVTFSDEADEGLLKKFEETLGERAESYVTVMETAMDLVVDDRVKSVNLVAMDENADISPYLGLHTPRGELLPLPGRGECILNEKLAEDYHVEVGDTVILRENESRSMELTVAGINENFVYNYAYVTLQTYESLLGEPAQCKEAYVNLAEGVDPHLLSASLMRLSQVTNVTVNADTRERFGSMMQSLDLIVLVVILCAAGLAFIVLYNLTNINITERIREIATIKVLGFYQHETEAYVFRENVVLTLFGALGGLVLGIFLHRFVMDQIRVDMVAFQIKIKPLSFLYSVVLTFAFSWFVNKVMGKKLEEVSMTESLKSVD